MESESVRLCVLGYSELCGICKYEDESMVFFFFLIKRSCIDYGKDGVLQGFTGSFLSVS